MDKEENAQGQHASSTSEADDAQDTRSATGIPAEGLTSDETYSPTGGPGLRHWRQATITDPDLNNRGGVFFAAIEMTRMPMILTDPNIPENPIVFANRAFLDLTGYTLDDIIGRNCRFLQGAGTDRAAVAEMRDAIAAQEAVAVELLNYRRDGTAFWNAVYIAPVYDRGGKLLYFFASQLDITRRRMSEQAFRQAQKMESIGQLTAGLAHDFNNLLQVVLGNLDNAGTLVKGDEPRLRRALDNATAAAERGAKLTRQLLAFARRTRLDPKVVDVNDLLDQFSDMMETTIGKQVDLRLSCQRRLPPVKVDTVHFEMALLNVVINARDAMAKGGTITVETSTMELEPNGLAGGRYVAVSVIDQGEGMTPAVLERATEPFFTTKKAGMGTGLGLAMAHGFAKQSLGTLQIESERGRGTTVRFLFPVTDGAVEARRAEAAQQPEPPASPEEGATETILVVEDSEDVLTLAREHLEGLGYRVLVARSGEEALEVLHDRGRERIDLLFSDIVMPGGVNGLVLAETVRAQMPELPVLLTTGYNDELALEGPRAAAMDVIGKPYRRTELADRVRAALNGAARDRAPRRATREAGPRHEG